MKSKFAFLVFAGLCALALSISNASAAQIVVSDCDGAIRAIGDSGESTNTSVVIKLAADQELAATGVPVTLSNGIDTKSSLSNDEGKLSFEKVAAGKWTACAQDKAIKLADVSVVKTNPEATMGPIALLGAGLAGVGGIALGGLSGSSDSNSQPQGTLSELAGTGQNSGLVDSAGSAPEVAAARGPRAQADCKTNEKPDTLSPFL